MTYEDESSARGRITQPLVMLRLRSDLAIGCVESYPDKRSARGGGAGRIGRRLSLYGQLYGLSLLIGHGP
jgi:hypothetical protein